MIKIYIDSNFNAYYASFYLKGLYDLFGHQHIFFNHTFFKGLSNPQSNFNFILLENGNYKRFSIDFGDHPSVNDSCYEWCDVYGKVNTSYTLTSKFIYNKIVTLAPGFGIQIWSLNKTVFFAFSNFLRGSQLGLKKFLGIYKRMHKFRSKYNLYAPAFKTTDDYIFHLSTLWYSNSENMNDEVVNKSRANFIRACRKVEGLNFEGGLYYDQKFELNSDFKDVILYNYMSNNDYISKIKNSALVFNTPSFWQCHGWKLGEYLALGKAILSTPLINDLPEPLTHGINIHYIDDTSEQNIMMAIDLLLNDHKYRTKLERGAFDYWEKYGTPAVSIKRLGILQYYL